MKYLIMSGKKMKIHFTNEKGMLYFNSYKLQMLANLAQQQLCNFFPNVYMYMYIGTCIGDTCILCSYVHACTCTCIYVHKYMYM